jgi:crotonobetainyl-CoA:carnitine CoA-transferase CaiB-like acyl-CoA transferase
MAADPRFATIEARKRHEDEVEAAVEAWTAQQVDLDAMHLLQAAGVPAGIVETVQDMLESDYGLRERHFTLVSQPDGTAFVTHKDPVKFVGQQETVDRAPIMGEHNEYVFKALLGLSEDEIVELMAEGVIY